MWTFQRLLVPSSGTDLAPVYQSVLDPMVSLGFLAAATSSIRLGVAVVNHPFQSPLLLAKQASTVDALSGGRLDLGIGSGWLREEFAGSGAPMERRGALGRTSSSPRCARSGAGRTGDSTGPSSPFLAWVAGPAPGPAARAAGADRRDVARGRWSERGRIGDGWVTSSAADLSAIAESAKVVQEAARAAGRGPARIICRGVVRPGEPARLQADWAAPAAVRVVRADPGRRRLAGKLAGSPKCSMT